jgi:hypothetical protein
MFCLCAAVPVQVFRPRDYVYEFACRYPHLHHKHVVERHLLVDMPAFACKNIILHGLFLLSPTANACANEGSFRPSSSKHMLACVLSQSTWLWYTLVSPLWTD